VGADSFSNGVNEDASDVPTIATAPMEVALQRLKVSEAYWAGYSGMLIGSSVYCGVLALVLSVVLMGPASIVVLIGGTICGVALVGVVGALVFWVVRVINGSSGWLLPSRFAAMTAACLTGLSLLLAPTLFFGGEFYRELRFGYVFFGPVLLTSFLQAGAWLAADREIRKFQQRAAFGESDHISLNKEYRFGIRRLLVWTFWVAGVFAIFRAVDQVDQKVHVAVASLFTVFLSFGFSGILIGLTKTLRALQKWIFYRKRRRPVPPPKSVERA